MGRSAPFPPDHDVASFVREARISAVGSEAQLDRLKHLAETQVYGGAMPAATWPAQAGAEELRLRNHELSAISDELREQIDMLTRACSLLERERAKYVDLFRGAPNAYVVTDLAGVAQDANIAASALFGLESGALMGRSLSSFVLPADSTNYRHLLRAATEATSGPAPSGTLRVSPPGQAAIVVRARANPVRSIAGQTVALRWMFQRHEPRDVAYEQSLRETSVAALAVGVLGGLVSRIKGSAEILREGEACEEREREQALAWIESSAGLQQSFLDDLGELAALYDQDGGTTIEEVDLVHFLDIALHELPSAILEQRKTVVEGAGACAPVLVDPARLGRGLELLVRRVAAGTPQGGVLRARASILADEVLVDIETDAGAAPSGWDVRMAIAARIFEMFGGHVVAGDRAPSMRLRLPLNTP